MNFDALRFQKLFAATKERKSEAQPNEKEIIEKLVLITKKYELGNNDAKLEEFNIKANSFFESGNYKSALKFLEKIEELQSLTDHQLCIKGEAFVRLGKSEEARKIIDEAITKDPQNVSIIYIQGLMHYYDLELEKSIVRFELALHLDKSFSVALHAKRFAMSLFQSLNSGELLKNFIY